ncbi:hypothetical protein [Mycolicibacterium sp. J2]|uniref:hypothetical protein n=1 Tax=Mycolicibacterium sp. J2 TaxID=2993511 RepID=UPI00224B2889|nr:hypothetical protein [Mycolicibacterium sp. J2]MCX2710451.1 hypothetical protein [Mycolicibacterium sp. J2]
MIYENAEDGDIAQARLLLAALWEQVEEISRKIEAAEGRIERAHGGPHMRHHRSRAAQLRHELYQAHHMIDRLGRRFPQARTEFSAGVHLAPGSRS